MTETAAFHSDASKIPDVPGAYILLLELVDKTVVRLPSRPGTVLSEGRYLYCGSARGPGGLKARVGRHMRPDKTVHWHVDQLTTQGRVLGAWVFPGGNECALAANLAMLPRPIPGFGSSDCRHCVSHLLTWPQGVTLPFFKGSSFQG